MPPKPSGTWKGATPTARSSSKCEAQTTPGAAGLNHIPVDEHRNSKDRVQVRTRVDRNRYRPCWAQASSRPLALLSQPTRSRNSRERCTASAVASASYEGSELSVNRCWSQGRRTARPARTRLSPPVRGQRRGRPPAQRTGPCSSRWICTGTPSGHGAKAHWPVMGMQVS